MKVLISKIIKASEIVLLYGNTISKKHTVILVFSRQTYIHRSGRTARARKEGLSILLIEPSEMNKYRQLCGTLNRATDLPPFPVDIAIMNQVKKRIKLAHTVEYMEHSIRKANAEKDWLRKVAQEAELLLDEYVKIFS